MYMTMDLSPIIISLKTATLSIIITFFLGVAAAQFVFRLKSKTMKTILDGLFTLPLVLPPTVAGFFLLYIFGMRRPIGKFLIEYFAVKIAFSWGATVLAAVVISFPLMYRSARGAFEQVNPDVLSAGRTLGMSEWSIFFRVMIPNADCMARSYFRSSSCICQRTWRVWSNSNDCRKYQRKDKNTAISCIFGSCIRKNG